MKLRFGLRELLLFVTIFAAALTLFVYLPTWEAATLALLLAIAVPLSGRTDHWLEGIFWCLIASMICYHLGVLVSVNQQQLLAYPVTCLSWISAIGYGLRRSVRQRNRVWLAGLTGMALAWVFVPDYFMTDSWLIDNERPHWLGISLGTLSASSLAVLGSHQTYET